MGEVRYAESAQIAAPPEIVYAYRLDFRNLPAYNASVANLRRTDDGTQPGEGAAYAFDVTIEGMGTIPTTLVVVAAEPPGRIVTEMNAGLVAREVCAFEPSGSGTRVDFDVSVFVPDDLDAEGRAFIEHSGRTQVRAELDALVEILAPGAPA